VILEGHGLALELPHGWSGRLFSRQAGAVTLHAGNFPVALGDGEFGDSSLGAMRDGGCFLALVEYVPGGTLQPGQGLFAARGVPRTLDPTSLRVNSLAHPRPGQVGVQHFCTVAGRPFCLYVVLAGARVTRRSQLSAVEHILGRIRINPR
jgi:hypothetical protein